MVDRDPLYRSSRRQIPEGDLGIASRDELMRCAVISPKLITEHNKIIRPGFVAALDRKHLNPDDIHSLVFPTKQWQYEVGFSFDPATDKFYYFLGDRHRTHITPEQYKIGHRLLRNILVDVHTHPSWSFLYPSPGDKESYLWTGDSCRFFIGTHGDPEENRFEGLVFREFTRQGDKINGEIDAEQLSVEIAKIV